MKHFSLPSILVSFAVLSPVSLSAFTTVFPIGTFNAPNMEVAGVDGWTINDPGFTNGVSDHLSFVSTIINGSPAASLGGWNDIPSVLPPFTVFLSHAAATNLEAAIFSTQFAVAASSAFYPGRDGFGFSFRDAGNNNLLTISLVPVAEGGNDSYRIQYALGANPAVNSIDQFGDPMYVSHNGLYSLNLNFTPNGANPTFSASFIGSNVRTFTGTATGFGAATIDRFGVEWNTLPGQMGNNFITIDNVTMIPEPSSSVLICLAGLGFAARRKRA